MKYPLLEVEREADPDGKWIPYGVRMKLDLVGRKIALNDWQAVRPHAREELIGLSVETDQEMRIFDHCLERALTETGLQAQVLPDDKLASVGDWRDAGDASDQASALLHSLGALELWPQLDRFGRYVVCVFARKQDLASARSALIQLGRIAP